MLVLELLTRHIHFSRHIRISTANHSLLLLGPLGLHDFIAASISEYCKLTLIRF